MAHGRLQDDDDGHAPTTAGAAPGGRPAWALALAGLAALALPGGAHAERRVLERPASGPAGSVVALAGTGFAPRRAVVVATGHRRLAVVGADARGRFTASIRVPVAARSSVALPARDRRGRTVSRFAVRARRTTTQTSELATEAGTRLRWTPSLVGPAAGPSGWAAAASLTRSVVPWSGWAARCASGRTATAASRTC